MTTYEKYENFPIGTVMLSNLVSFSIYGLGFLIMLYLGWLLAFLYLAFVLFLEFRILKNHCIDCYYYGKRCGFGKGVISALFFKRGNPSKFCEKNMSWKNMIPDMMISLIPVIGGIFLLITSFKGIILAALLLIIILTTAGNGYIRGSLTCKYCKQRELGCPADRLFNKKE